MTRRTSEILQEQLEAERAENKRLRAACFLALDALRCATQQDYSGIYPSIGALKLALTSQEVA